MDSDAEEGVGSISGVDAMNVNPSEQGPTQATQQSQSSQAGPFYKILKQPEQCRLSSVREGIRSPRLPVSCILLHLEVALLLSLKRKSSSHVLLCTFVNQFVSLPVRCESRHHI